MQIIILHTNDTHGHLLPLPDASGSPLGGYARRASFVNMQRAKNPHTLLLDAGDYYQGSRYWHAFRGAANIELMNTLRYDVGALGNHDTDGGNALLAERLRQANFPVLCANMTFPKGHILADAWQPYIIKEIEGVKIAIFSMLIDALPLYLPEFRDSVQITPAIETARALVSKLRKQADVVIHLSHLGQLGDIEVAEAVTGIDLIIGGHTHLPLEKPLMVKGTPIIRAIAGGQLIGQAELDISEKGIVTLTDYRLHPLGDDIPDDTAVTALIESWRRKLPPERVLGQLDVPLDTRSAVKGGGESAAGNFFVDAMRTYFGNAVDLAFVHMGTLRGDRIYAAGDFSNHDLSEYHPFDNTPTLMTLTAPQLKIMLERGVSALPYTVGTFLSQAGLRVTVDVNRQAQIIDAHHPKILTSGERIIRAEFEGTAIDFSDENCTFNVVMDGYIGRGGAGYFITKSGQNVRLADVSGSDVLKWYLYNYSPVNAAPKGRFVFV